MGNVGNVPVETSKGFMASVIMLGEGHGVARLLFSLRWEKKKAAVFEPRISLGAPCLLTSNSAGILLSGNILLRAALCTEHSTRQNVAAK